MTAGWHRPDLCVRPDARDGSDLWQSVPVPAYDLMLDPFWVGRRADAFDETCR